MSDSTSQAFFPDGDRPFRARALSATGLGEHAAQLANLLTWTTDRPPQEIPLRAMADDAEAELAEHNRLLHEALLGKQAISLAAEWLLDNHYLLEAQVSTIRGDLPAGYGRELPRIVGGPFGGLPRIWAIAVNLVAHTDARVDEENLAAFVDGFQRTSPLSIGEVWAIPIMLRIALVENVRRLARNVVAAHQAERLADSWADRLLLIEPGNADELEAQLRALDAELGGGFPEIFFARLSQRLTGREVWVDLLGVWLEQRLAAGGVTLDELNRRLQREQAADQVSIANTITSTRFLEANEWRSFFEQASVVEQVLRQDPSGVYPRMDFGSRDRYRHALEELARRSPLDEPTCAEATVSLCLEALSRAPGDAVAGHVGHYLIDAGRYTLEKAVSYRPRARERLYRGPLARKWLLYAGSMVVQVTVLALSLALWLLSAGAEWYLTLAITALALIPFSELALSTTNRIAAWLFPPRVLPKLDYLQPVSEAHRTLVVVPTLLSSVASVRRVLDNIEVAYLANIDDDIGFGLLGDLRTAAEQHAPADAAIIEAAERGVAALNARYLEEHGREPFALFLRERRFNEAEGAWMGWERKRGSLHELNHWLRGSFETSFAHVIADEAFLRPVTFVITLDADTILPRDNARKLIGAIAHPLNRARWAPGEPLVRGGYGLVQPRVAMALPASARSFYAWLHSGDAGLDPYAGAASDTYQDVFGEGSFTGKGIYEVSVFIGVLEGRFPENTLLSHDLIEGCFIRVMLASDIEVLDDHPATYLAQAARMHRWVRGDWQTLPWLLPRIPAAEKGMGPNPLRLLHRWKIVDNLRRSLYAPSLLAFVTLGWMLTPGPALAWAAGVTLLVFFPAYFRLLDSFFARRKPARLRRVLANLWREFVKDVTRALLTLILLPHQAQQMCDAIVRALWRMLVSKRKLLEWETAADVESRIGDDMAGYVRRLGPASAVAVALLFSAAYLYPERALMSIPLAALWIAAPFVAWRISQVTPRVIEGLDEGERLTVRTLARRTWRFFEDFVTPEGHYLAPDNFQEDPKGEIAWRTSPTNIGMQMLSTLSAWDLGYVTLDELVERSADTLNATVGLERFAGHYYNWYDIRTLQPLPPKYVSTVDSGNLAGHLLVFRIGVVEASEAPVLTPALLDGLVDTIRLAVEDLGDAPSENRDDAQRLSEALGELARDVALEESPSDLGQWHVLVSRIETLWSSVSSLWPDELDRRSHDMIAARLGAIRRLLSRVAPWSELLVHAPTVELDDATRQALCPLLEHVPSLVGLAEGLDTALAALDSLAEAPPGDTPAGREKVAAWAAALAGGIRETRPACQELLGRLRVNATISRQMWEHMDFSLLFDERRLLFAIGYNTAEGRLDASYYDMLASECRLASFLAIAKGDVPQEHWFRLGRSITAVPGGQRALVSWSASMFEYLMPLLVMRRWPLTLLDETYSAVLERQIQYGREQGVPWGVSESAFNAKDSQLTYQYQAFGVPGLGLKRGLSSDLVIAPYATALAMQVSPKVALANLAELAKQDGCGRYGYYEALDYTPGRVPAGARRALVKAYFAHHQGMSFVAFANALTRNRMQARFHGDPMVRSAELLLHERVPKDIPLAKPHVEEVEHVRTRREPPPASARTYPLADTPVPSTHFLSNGRYAVMVTNGGGGYSRWKDLAVTRYREDVTRDCWGHFLYLRDVDSGAVWGPTHNPCPKRPDRYLVRFASGKAEFERREGTIETQLEVVVSPEDDIEIRRLTIANRGREARTLEVTSYMEAVLAAQGADQAHRGFSNLFVETEAVPAHKTLLFSRRPRSAHEARPFGIHTLACETGEDCDSWSYETSRAVFLGRLNDVTRPAAVMAGGELGLSEGAVLDPVCSIRRRVTLEPGTSVKLAFVTGAAESRPEALRLAEKYHDIRNSQRAMDLAWTTAQIELRDLGLSPTESVVLQRLASRLLLTDPTSVLKVKTPVENGLPMAGLWSLGISGDLPILLVRVEDLTHTPLVRQALLAHQYWRHKGLAADLVILNTRPTSYADDLEDRLRLLMRTGHSLQLIDRPGGVFLRRADQMHPDIHNLLLSVARATLEGDGGSIEVQLNRKGVRPEDPAPLVPTSEPAEDPAPQAPRPALAFDNGYGGFDPDTGDYVIVLEDGAVTPAPWVNVMASPRFGCMVSEAGMACTWAENSHENRITTWNNDPVSDGSGEMLYIRDEDTGQFWSPTLLPARGPGTYTVRHSTGSSRFTHTSHGISSALDVFIPADDPVRIARLKLTNTSGRTRRLSVTQFVEWVLGSSRSRAQHQVVTWYDAEHESVTAHNHYNPDYPGRATFLACDQPLHSYTCSRTEFVGRNGRLGDPAAMRRVGLGGRTGRYHDNCGAVMTMLTLEPGESASVGFLLGQTTSLDESRTLIARYREPGAIDDALIEVRNRWSEMLRSVQVRTPDPALDLLVNGWLLYQATSCRLWGRTATYQSSGAFGFRDQLQDVLALLVTRPDLVRTQIVEASRHQFPEGDVLHWWQPATGRGVRTRITDDRHWMPYVLAEYLTATGDESVLHERTAFIEGPALEEGQEDNYMQPAVSERTGSVYEHCCAALDSGAETGPHGLPLMGGGDWNDGMSRVGIEGRGESVWLAWFLSATLTRFAPVCELMGEHSRAATYRERAAAFAAAVEKEGWDGAWYRRAYFDDGTPLGTRHAEECRIDAIAQAWATISGTGDPRRAASALNAVEEKLVRREAGIIALLSPPFDKMEQDPGYIKGYVPGVRENGGQYTHAALWVILAHLMRGDGDEAHDLFELINPINHALTEQAADVYRVEPYVVAADVYSAKGHSGRGGWTWYTGSASWFYQVAVGHLLGLKVVTVDGERHLAIDPCIPKSWPEYSITYRDKATTYEIRVENPRGVNRGVARIGLDGAEVPGGLVPLARDGGTHEVLVTLLGG